MNRLAHTEPSPRCMVRYIERKYPEILEEAKREFKPLLYPLDLMDKIKGICDMHYDWYDCGLFTVRDIMLGAVVLIYSKYPISHSKKALLHSSAHRYASKAFSILPPNLSENLNKVLCWMKMNENFMEHCEFVKRLTIESNN